MGPHNVPRRFCVLVVIFLTFSEHAVSQSFSGVLTWHNDNYRTGQNLNETTLTPQNVSSNTFGKIFRYLVDGQVYAQPLYVPAVAIPNLGTRNVVYVATENDSVYAFDADGLSASPLWRVSFIDPLNGVTAVPCLDQSDNCNVYPILGITSTPVIDPASGTLYVIARTKENGGWVQRLHALDIGSGTEKFGDPAVVQATVAGTGSGSKAGNLPYNPKLTNSRAALLLSKGVVYVAWTGVHGWVMAFDAHSLQLLNAFVSTPNSNQNGGIWMSGGGMAADGDGNVYFSVAEGTFDVNHGGPDWSESLLKVSPSLQVLDFFSPSDQVCRFTSDYDLASGGPMLLPAQTGNYPNEIVDAGKGGYPCDSFAGGWGVPVYLINRDNMGGYNPTVDASLQTVMGIPVPIKAQAGGYWASPAYWSGPAGPLVYLSGLSGEHGLGDYLKAFSLINGGLSSTPIAQSTNLFPVGSTPSVSANGASNGIVWSIQRQDALATRPGNLPAVLYAYDASNVATTLYNSTQAGARDQAGAGMKFATPTIANGRVYMPTQTEVDVYGLLSQAPPQPMVSLSPNSLTFTNQVVGSTSLSQTATLTNTGTASLLINAVSSAGDFLLNTTDTSCPYSGGFVGPGSSCSLDVSFAPTQLGARIGSLTISSNAAGSPQGVALSGSGANPTSALLLPMTYAVGTSPQGLTTADFNRDGHPDLAVANSGDNTVSILLGNGDGTFSVAATLATDSGPIAVVTSDFDNNGIPDLAVVNQASGTVSIFLGNGDGTFRLGTPLAGLSAPDGIAVGDFNKDGQPDLAVANSSGGTVSVFLGNSDGSFTALAPLALPSGTASSIVVGDFNRDGNPDLAISDGSEGLVWIVPGDGTGGFGMALSYYSGNGANALLSGDWNGDSLVDLAVANPADNSLSLLMGNGDGTFQPTVTLPGLASPLGLASADFNGDGRSDLAVTNSSTNFVGLLFGTIGGGFQTPVLNSVGAAPWGVTTADFNADGWTDLAVTNSQSNSVSILLQGAQASLSGMVLSFGEEIVGGTSAAEAVVLTNTSNAPMSVNNAILTGVNPSDFALSSTCTPLPVRLAAGGQCQFTVAFIPSASGNRSAGLQINDTAGSGSQMISLAGVGTAPQATYSSAAVNFGSVAVGASASASVLLTNSGTAMLTLSAISASSNFSTAVTPTSCPYAGGSLLPRSSCTIDLSFAPASFGPLPGTLSIVDNAMTGTQVLALKGSGAAATVTLTPLALKFNPQLLQTSSPPQTITASNVSGVAAAISLSFSGTNPADFSKTTTCPASLSANSACTISVVFTPSAMNGRSAQLTVNEAGSPISPSVGLSGTGIAPVVKLIPGSINFPAQKVGTASPAQSVTLSNTGTAPLTIASIAIAGGNASEFSVTSSTCGKALAAKLSCSFSVVFAPASKGNKTTGIYVTDNSGNGKQKVGLSGTGN